MKNKPTLAERVIKRLGGATRADVDTAVHRAIEAASVNMSANDEPVSGTTKSYGYRRAVARYLRDFSKISRSTALETAWTLWQSSPVAKRLLVIKRGYILGDGINPRADDEDLQDILFAFWRANKLDGTRDKEFTLQLFLLGEQCYPVFVRRADGAVKLGYIDPGQIENVITHPQNVMEPWAVVVSGSETLDAWEAAAGKRVLRIVRLDEGYVDGEQVIAPLHSDRLVTAEQALLEPWEMEMLKEHGLSAYSGSCFFFKVNSVSNQPRGYSDLLQLADWLDQLDETLFNLAEREQMAGYFAWDVTLADADAPAIAVKRAELNRNPPKKGSVNVHNQGEVWDLKTPDLKQSGTIATYEALLTLALGGYGYPRHWFGSGADANLATAAAQGDPTWRSLEDAQDTVRSMFMMMLEFARDQAEIAGAWKPADEEARKIDLPMPEMSAKDTSRATSTLPATASALELAVTAGWTTNETAAKVWAALIGELGVEINVTAEMEEIEKELKKRDLDDAEKTAAALRAKLKAGQEPENEPDTEMENAG